MTDHPIRISEQEWHMWALPSERGLGTGKFGYTDPGHRFSAQAHSQGTAPVPVRVTVTQDGPYWGWLATGEDIPTMIFGHKIPFNMCFPYTPQAEVKAGHGQILRLDIQALDA